MIVPDLVVYGVPTMSVARMMPSLSCRPPSAVVPEEDCACQSVSVGTMLRIISRFNALSELGLLSVSMPSLEEREGRNCVVKDVGGGIVMVHVVVAMKN